MVTKTTLQRALISVTDKTDIVPFAKSLHALGVEILSTGGTAEQLRARDIPVTDISRHTAFPEMMDGRLKTLHPKIFGGILGRRDLDVDIMTQHQLDDIDLVVVNLYQFQQTVAKKNVTLNEAIEKIDIGGPSLIRAAAKNYKWVTVATAPADYKDIVEELNEHNGITEHTRFRLAQKAFKHTAEYDGQISNYLSKLPNESQTEPDTFGQTLNLQFNLKDVLRYGENPHQQAAVYHTLTETQPSFLNAKQLQGKALSYNNILDGDAALKCVQRLQQPSCVIVKHTNPCGVATGADCLKAYEKAYQCDPQSAFGGIIAFNQIVDAKLMDTIFGQQFVEVIIAPQFDDAAVKIAQNKPNCRLMQYKPAQPGVHSTAWQLKSVAGGLLVQSAQAFDSTFEAVTTLKANEQQKLDLAFAWKVIQSVKSNAIVIAKDLQTLGIGPGQTSRVFSIEIAKLRAKAENLSLKGAVMASDAFFPFKDSIELAHELGISAIIQPGGAQRDAEIIEKANELGIVMLFTHTRQFLH